MHAATDPAKFCFSYMLAEVSIAEFQLMSSVSLFSPSRHTAIIVIVCILSVTMSTSAVDSLQNAIVDNISGVYLKHAPLLVVRGLVLALTVPPMIVSLKVQILLTSARLCSSQCVVNCAECTAI